MSAREVFGRIEAHRVAKHRTDKRMDTLAWMVGHYTAHAYHAPKKYPKKPGIVQDDVSPGLPEHARPMDEDMMQTVMTAYAEIHNEIEGAKP